MEFVECDVVLLQKIPVLKKASYSACPSPFDEKVRDRA